ncbi:UDP-glucuronic acid decarboxylase 6-like protein [Tanacetum coccineum]|uniref:UDP-glucuronic acid decarboxylase 6-like protein n=1 Tax=Tanacetum coccineum TaxID=301880 RepID=A0ABQ4YSI7_9ASTR
MPTSVLIAAVEAAKNILPVAAHEEAETIHNMTTENKLYFQAEKEAIFLILTGIGDEIYSTIDACNTAKEMWIAIERLQQGESLNVQDVKTNLLWEFGKFTSRDGESMESYYSRFYKLMNELTRNNLQVTLMQETTSSTLICFMAKASPTQAWLWHQRLSHLNFDTINLLSKKDIVNGLPKLKYAKDQLVLLVN